MGVIAEAMVCFIVAQAMLEKFGGDSVGGDEAESTTPTSRTSPNGSASEPSSPHLILVGLPGSGKSTVGRRVARRLGRPFLDFDSEIERREGRSIAQIFAEAGEPGFRELELALTRGARRHRRDGPRAGRRLDY